MSRLPAALLVRFAAALLPAGMRDWGRGMVAEAAAIGGPGPALRFAFGCLWAAMSLRFSRLFAGQEMMMNLPTSSIDRPRRLGIACAAAAVGLGFAYMAAAGAPGAYFAMNGAALAIGLLALGVLAEARRLGQVPSGLVAVTLSAAMLLVSLYGVSADGVMRWIAVGGVMLQPSLVLVPALALSFAYSRSGLSTLAVIVAALALALQPDRAMAGALAAAMAALVVVRRDRNGLAALVATLAALTATLIRPDPSPAMPFVDQIFFSSFTVHPLAGIAVAGGAVLLLVPAIVGLRRDPDHSAAYAAFGAVWLAAIVAAGLGNYPTPLVGYGGSAILGYLISLIGLPGRPAEDGIAESEAKAAEPDGTGTLRASLA